MYRTQGIKALTIHLQGVIKKRYKTLVFEQFYHGKTLSIDIVIFESYAPDDLHVLRFVHGLLVLVQGVGVDEIPLAGGAGVVEGVQ